MIIPREEWNKTISAGGFTDQGVPGIGPGETPTAEFLDRANEMFPHPNG